MAAPCLALRRSVTDADHARLRRRVRGPFFRLAATAGYDEHSGGGRGRRVRRASSEPLAAPAAAPAAIVRPVHPRQRHGCR